MGKIRVNVQGTRHNLQDFIFEYSSPCPRRYLSAFAKIWINVQFQSQFRSASGALDQCSELWIITSRSFSIWNIYDRIACDCSHCTWLSTSCEISIVCDHWWFVWLLASCVIVCLMCGWQHCVSLPASCVIAYNGSINKQHEHELSNIKIEGHLLNRHILRSRLCKSNCSSWHRSDHILQLCIQYHKCGSWHPNPFNFH